MAACDLDFFTLMYLLWSLPAVWSLHSADEVELSGTGRVTASFLSWEQVSLWAPSSEGCTRWRRTDPGACFSLLPSRVFIFLGFFFSFLLTFLTRKKMIWSVRYNFFLYIPPQHWPFKGEYVNFQSAFLAVQRRASKGDISSGICNQPNVEQLLLPLQNSRCRYLWLWFLVLQHSPFSLTPGPLRLGVKKCNISCRLLVWEEFLCICPDKKVLTHSEGRTQRRSGCVAALCDLKAICTGQDFFFFFASGAKQMSLEFVDCVCNRLFFIKQTFWLVIVRIVRVMMFSFHWSFPDNHDREPAGTIVRSTYRKGKKKRRKNSYADGSHAC